MRLSNVCDEDLRKVSLLKTRKNTYTSDAKHAQQILYTRNKTMGFCYGGCNFRSTLDANPLRQYRTFAEENDGLTIEEYLLKEKERQRAKDAKRASDNAQNKR